MPSTLDWLRERTDAQLADLLAARPDLLVPAPGDLRVLAHRLDAPATARRAIEMLDAFELQVLQALLVLGAAHRAESPVAVADLLGGPADAAEVGVAAEGLHTRALLRRDGDGYRVAPAARDALGPYPAGLGASSGIEPEQVAQALAGIDDDQRALLERLVPGPPLGVVEPRSPHLTAVDRLVECGLLQRIDQYTVALPREVALALRGPQPLGPALAAPPVLQATPQAVGTVDATAAAQALATHDRTVRLLELFGTAAVTTLKSGGMGIVALRRIAKDLDLTEHLAALHVELLAQAGLVAAVVPRSGSTGHWIPSQTADTFVSGAPAAGWSLLAATWLQMRRDPSRVGTRDANDKVCNALSAELGWRNGPAERHRLLGELAQLDPGSGADAASLAGRIAFHAPLRDPQVVAARVSAVLAEATELGLVAFGALCAAGRAVLADDIAAAAAAMEVALPPPTGTVLVQADMTVVAPGRLRPELAAALARAADVESAGGGTVYRISEASLRRALDAGATAAELHALLETHSATPVPQSIGYLIDDVARRHGVLRAGSTGAYLRSEDPALITQAVAAASAAGIAARALAPTVAVADTDLTSLVEVLRAARLAPAAEDAGGSVLDLRPRPRRTRITPPSLPRHATPSPPSAEQVAALVHRMRAGDATTAQPQSPAELLAVLRAAARNRAPVWIDFADTEGGTSRRIVEPIVVSGGAMVAHDRLRNAPRTFPLHRISSAHLGTPG